MMSGRNSTIRPQRGGRTRGGRIMNRNRISYDGQTKKIIESRKSMSDYIYYIGTSKQASDYVVVTKYLINHIQKTYINGEDIGKALETRMPLDFATLMPRLQISTSDDKSDQERENEQFKMLYKAEIDSYVKRKDTYHSNIGNAYALVYGQCSKAMQSKLQSRTDFETKIKGNPIELLCGIQEHSISYQEHQYEMTIIADAMCNLVNLKQKEDESLIDYTGRFKSAKDILETQIGGPIRLTKYIETMKDSKTPEKNEKHAYEQLMTYFYL